MHGVFLQLFLCQLHSASHKKSLSCSNLVFWQPCHGPTRHYQASSPFERFKPEVLIYIQKSFGQKVQALYLECCTCVEHSFSRHLCMCVSTMSSIFLFSFEKARHDRDTYLLFIFSLNFEYLPSYLLFTYLDLIC